MDKHLPDYEIVLEWFDKSIANARRMNKPDSAALWADGKQHLELMREQRDELLAALIALYDLAYGFNVSGVYFAEFKENSEALDKADEAIAKAESQS
jgi:hypothetical protein